MSNPGEWHSDFFTGLVVESQRLMNPESQTRAEAQFLQNELRLTPGSRVADVPCGDGRLTVALAEAGCDTIGVDGSEGLLQAARERLKGRSLPVEFHHRDMRDLPWENHFDGVFCVGNSFAYLDDAGNEAFLRAVYRSLKPGGRFAIDTGVVADSVLPNLVSGRWFLLGDIYFLHATAFDPLTSRLTSTYTLMRDGVVEKKQAVYRVYGCRELLKLCESVGFQVKETFGSIQGEAYKFGSNRLWLILEK